MVITEEVRRIAAEMRSGGGLTYKPIWDALITSLNYFFSSFLFLGLIMNFLISYKIAKPPSWIYFLLYTLEMA